LPFASETNVVADISRAQSLISVLDEILKKHITNIFRGDLHTGYINDAQFILSEKTIWLLLVSTAGNGENFQLDNDSSATQIASIWNGWKMLMDYLRSLKKEEFEGTKMAIAMNYETMAAYMETDLDFFLHSYLDSDGRDFTGKGLVESFKNITWEEFKDFLDQFLKTTQDQLDVIASHDPGGDINRLKTRPLGDHLCSAALLTDFGDLKKHLQ
jgi:hypothetical protein